MHRRERERRPRRLVSECGLDPLAHPLMRDSPFLSSCDETIEVSKREWFQPHVGAFERDWIKQHAAPIRPRALCASSSR